MLKAPDLPARRLLQLMEVLVPDDFRLRNSEYLTLDLAAVDADEVDLRGGPEELGVLGHDGDYGLAHLAVIVSREALERADVRGGEPVDVQLDDPVAAVGERVLVAELDVPALEAEGDLGHRKAVEVPGDFRARVPDRVLGDLLLLEEVRPVGVALERLLVDVEAPREPRGGREVERRARGAGSGRRRRSCWRSWTCGRRSRETGR